MNSEEFEVTARKWERTIEDVLIDILSSTDAKDLKFGLDVAPSLKAFNELINQARTAIQMSEIAIKLEESNEN